ncbi:hypothetical protein CNYM01_13280 [Colletotrichum nymphaeae SA-01]|uniref:Uncharacterized protein n=1 Tax=Colletotrichum nymphaeae SA-01 TaxID=1460502 RepID=A0A135UV21_9PEZI|nr:hypothetical protein CNYM01_13280 [Colletotrichum nymphaeae SA-01]
MRQLLVQIGHATMFLFLPGSHRYLIYREKYGEAEKVLKRISARPETIPQEVQLLKAQVQGMPFTQNLIVAFTQQLGFSDPLRTNLMMTGCSFAVHIITFLTFYKIGRRRSICGIQRRKHVV